MLIPLGFLGAGKLGTFELISTQVLSSTGNITFSSIPQNYKHLQLRITARDATSAGGGISTSLRINGVTTSSYAWHYLDGTGASPASAAGSTAQTSILMGYTPSNGVPAGQFAGHVVDLADYTNANKKPVVRCFTAIAGSYQNVGIHSGMLNTAGAVTQLDIFTANGFVSGSRFSLYGVRG